MKITEHSKTVESIQCQCESARCFHGEDQCWHRTHTYYTIDEFATLALCVDCVIHYEKALS